VIGYEDSDLSVSGLRVFDGNYPTSLSEHIGLVTVSLTVVHGDVFLTQYRNLSFTADSQVGSLTVTGSVHDVNAALQSLVYVPEKDWNSAVDAEAVEDSVQSVVVTVQKLPATQVLSTSLSDAGDGVIIGHTNFTLQLNCSQYAASVMTSTHNLLNSSALSRVFSTSLLSADCSAATLQAAIVSIASQCDAIIISEATYMVSVITFTTFHILRQFTGPIPARCDDSGYSLSRQ
jgi:hypothetical protein